MLCCTYYAYDHDYVSTYSQVNALIMIALSRLENSRFPVNSQPLTPCYAPRRWEDFRFV